MLSAIIEALKSIVALKKTVREDKKLRLEIDKLERDTKEKDKLIRPATLEEVKEFDPKYRRIMESTTRKIEIGTIVTLVLAIIGGAFWLGGLQNKIDRIDPEKAATTIDAKISEAIAKSGTVPKGTIVAWNAKSGELPAGWAICDGNKNTPDLSGKFLRGVTKTGDIGQSGGAETHRHDVWHTTEYRGEGFQSTGDRCAKGDAANASSLPPYYTVVYIMKL